MEEDMRNKLIANLRDRIDNPNKHPNKTMAELIQERQDKLEADVQKLLDKHGVVSKPVDSNMREKLIENLRNQIKNPPNTPSRTMDELISNRQAKLAGDVQILRDKWTHVLNGKDKE